MSNLGTLGGFAGGIVGTCFGGPLGAIIGKTGGKIVGESAQKTLSSLNSSGLPVDPAGILGLESSGQKLNYIA